MSGSAIPPSLMTFLEDLDARTTGYEALELEFKRAAGGLPSSLWETVSAFANTNGGWLILGVQEAKGTFSIEGVPNAPEVLQRFFNLMRNRQKISDEVCGANDATIETLDQKAIIVIRIPPAPRTVRPVYIDNSPFGGTFVRRNAGDFRCSKAEVNRMMREASDVAADATILEHYSWDDLDHEAFRRYRQRFQVANPDHFSNAYDDSGFLQAIGGYRHDREQGLTGLTVAGLLMFGQELSIRDWRGRHMFDFRVLPDTLTASTEWDDRLIWEGNLYGAYEAIIPRLTAGLPVPFRLEDGVRVDNTPRHVALREALINLLVHADYTETRSSLIFRSPEGFYFQNPGSSRAPEADIGFGRPYEPRNPSLVFMFRQINLAEEAGSGIPRIRQTWRDLGYRAPEIDVGFERYEFSLQLSHVHLVPDEDRAWLQSLGQEWQEPEQLALLMARHDGDVDNARLRSVTGLHPADATKVLGSLRNQGVLMMTGWGRGASYQLSAEASMLSAGASILPAEASMLSAGASILPAATDTSLSSATAPADEPSSLVRTFATWMELERIAAEVHGRRRVPRSTLRQVVLGLCLVQPLSVQELAELTRRGATYIGQMIVGPLVAEGLLGRRYPDQPSHPDQRYVTPLPPHDEAMTDTEGDRT